MESYDFRAQRLFVPDPLGQGAEVLLDRSRAHYVADVIRLGIGEAIHLFNGRDGEWLARRIAAGRRDVRLACERLLRTQKPRADLDYVFAPLKQARLDYMVQKAVEMGAGRLVPVITRHTQVARVNGERMRANVVEAAEQCGVLAVPEVAEPVRFDAWLAALEPDRAIVFCDEDAAHAEGLDRLAHLDPAAPLAVIVGPEGGFAAEERTALRRREGTVALWLGPRILRADTAAVAALALVQAEREARHGG